MNKIFVHIHGNIQSGKSSTIKTSIGESANNIVTGWEDGCSTTGVHEQPEAACISTGQYEICMQDTVGFNYTERKFSDKKIMETAKLNMLASGQD